MATGGRDIRIGGGANLIQQYLNAGLVEELTISLAPVLLGEGTRLFECIDFGQVGLELVDTVPSEHVTHLRYAVSRAQRRGSHSARPAGATTRACVEARRHQGVLTWNVVSRTQNAGQPDRLSLAFGGTCRGRQAFCQVSNLPLGILGEPLVDGKKLLRRSVRIVIGVVVHAFKWTRPCARRAGE